MKSLTVVSGISLALALCAAVFFIPTVSSKNQISQNALSKTATSESVIVYTDHPPLNGVDIITSDKAPLVGRTAKSRDAITPFDASAFVKPSAQELKKTLSSIEFKVTQKDGTERPFSSPLHDEKRAGLYVDVVSGEPLFSSSDKFDSGTGWPSFIRPITEGVVIEKDDRSLFGVRTEIRSAVADSHLGHVFNDGPAPTGQRYCMNAAAMRFVPLEQMVNSGYGAYVQRVAGKT